MILDKLILDKAQQPFINYQTKKDKNTVMMIAAKHCYRLNVIKRLLTFNPNLNIQNSDGQTAIMLMFDKPCYNYMTPQCQLQYDMIEYIKDKNKDNINIDINIEDKNKLTAINYLFNYRQNKYDIIVKFLDLKPTIPERILGITSNFDRECPLKQKVNNLYNEQKQSKKGGKTIKRKLK